MFFCEKVTTFCREGHWRANGHRYGANDGSGHRRHGHYDVQEGRGHSPSELYTVQGLPRLGLPGLILSGGKPRDALELRAEIGCTRVVHLQGYL